MFDYQRDNNRVCLENMRINNLFLWFPIAKRTKTHRCEVVLIQLDPKCIHLFIANLGYPASKCKQLCSWLVNASQLFGCVQLVSSVLTFKIPNICYINYIIYIDLYPLFSSVIGSPWNIHKINCFPRQICAMKQHDDLPSLGRFLTQTWQTVSYRGSKSCKMVSNQWESQWFGGIWRFPKK